MRTLLLLIIILFIMPETYSQVYDMVVAKSGTGVYSSIQTAINKVADNKATRTTIFIKNGTYKEKINIPSTKLISLIGESAEGVIITYDDYSGKVVGSTTLGTSTSYTFWVQADNFYAENITFKNSSGNVGQAVAVRTTGYKQIFNRCRFYGFQDTYYTHNKSNYNLNCYIEGATDFIFGDATTVFDSCTINCVRGGHYITAPSDTKLISRKPNGDTLLHGMLFRNCTITSNADVSEETYYLARPWKDRASSVYINCKLGKHISSEGWSVWATSGVDADNHLTGYFAEYKSQTLDSKPVDLTVRVPWSKQLTDNEVANYYNLDTFYYRNNEVWKPYPIDNNNLKVFELQADKTSLTWKSDTVYKGFIIFRNDSVIGFSSTSSFTDSTADSKIENKYYIKSVSSKYGNAGSSSNVAIVAGPASNAVAVKSFNFEFLVKSNIISVNENADIKIYSIQGILLKHKINAKEITVGDLKNGIYIIVAVNKIGNRITRKMVL